MSDLRQKTELPSPSDIKFDMDKTVLLADYQGNLKPYPMTDSFWIQEACSLPKGYLISKHEFSESWPNWEQHPAGDEFVIVLRGELTLLFKHNDTVYRQMLSEGNAAIIPAGVWHSAKITKPASALFISCSKDTQVTMAVP